METNNTGTQSEEKSKDQENICCSRFNSEPWQDKIIEWQSKKFIKDKVFTLFYIPLNFGSVIKRMIKKVNATNAKTSDCLCLSDHTSKWNMDLYLAVNNEVPGAENTTISGKFYTKVYEGPYKDTKKWMDNFSTETKNLNIEKHYQWYTTCPKCAKKYGKNYVVIFGKIR